MNIINNIMCFLLKWLMSAFSQRYVFIFIRPVITNVKLTEVKHVSFKRDQAKRAAQMTTNITLTVLIKVFEWLPDLQ